MNWILVITAVLIIWGLFFFRRQIFYSQHTPIIQHITETNEDDQSKNLYNTIKNLLYLPQVRKLRLSHDMLNNIYLSYLDNKEIIWIKKTKSYNPLIRFFLQLHFHGFEWFLKGQSIENYIEVLNNCSDHLNYENRIVVKITSEKEKNQELNIKVSRVLLNYLKEELDNEKLSNLDTEELNELFSKTLKTATHFVRGVGYIHYRHLIVPKVNWEEPGLFKMMESIGSQLDPEIFKIRFRLVNVELIASLHADQFLDKNFIVCEYRSDPMSRVQATARNQLNAIKNRFNLAKELAKEKLNLFNNRLGDYRHLASVTGYTTPDPRELETYNTSEEIIAQEKLIAKTLVKYLKNMGRRSIKDSIWNSLVLIADRFIKRSNKNILGEEYENLLNQVVATKLGVTIEILNSNEGFQEFAYKSHLHRYMAVYGHNLEIVGDSNEIKILCNGEVRYWKDIKDTLRIDPETKQFLGHYSETGLISRGLTDWTELVPFKHEPQLPPPWGNKYICEIVSWIIDSPRINGDHSFLRFKTPQGEWYSVGQYMPIKHNVRDQFIFPMRVKQCRFMCPDISEFWEGPATIIEFEISKASFLEMKRKLEDDQKKKEHLYQFLHDNCTIYAKSILEIADIQFPSSMSLSDLLFPNISRWGRALHRMKWTPKWIRPLIRLSWTMMINCVLLVFGSGAVDRELRGTIKGIMPFVSGWKDFTDPRKVISEHPFVIGHFVRKQIEEWREARTQVLLSKKESLQKKINQLNPPKTDESNTSTLSKRPMSYINIPTLEETQVRRQLKLVEKALEDVKYAIPSRFRRKNHLPSAQSPVLSPLITPINFDEEFNFDKDEFSLNQSAMSPMEFVGTKTTKIHAESP